MLRRSSLNLTRKIAMSSKTTIQEILCNFFLNRPSIFLGNDLRLGQTTPVPLLEAFFKAVHPVTTNHRLIRIGGDADGGYLIPDDLAGIQNCFSPGVSDVADFELALAERGIRCLLADYSVNQPPVEHSKFHFEKKFLGIDNDEIFTTLESWIERNNPDSSDMILQMDIEGAEYGVISDTSHATLGRFRILVIEFHELSTLLDRQGYELINNSFRKLLRQFDIVHAHTNNYAKSSVYKTFEIPPVIEFTFLRKDRISTRQPTTVFPHPLDHKNVPDRPDIVLPKCWYAAKA
jgi:hypothetical protein